VKETVSLPLIVGKTRSQFAIIPLAFVVPYAPQFWLAITPLFVQPEALLELSTVTAHVGEPVGVQGGAW
jgi:hypothetical protein